MPLPSALQWPKWRNFTQSGHPDAKSTKNQAEPTCSNLVSHISSDDDGVQGDQMRLWKTAQNVAQLGFLSKLKHEFYRVIK
jgi:hypothetical protein